MKKALYLVLGLLICISFAYIANTAKAETDRLVPSQYPTIQAGIDASEDTDTVLVADGTYTGPGNINLDLCGKAITVKSENGPEKCIIDCESSARGFHFHSGETADSVVDGFTIQNGLARWIDPPEEGWGAGIFCENSSNPTITNCILKNNSADDRGGAICCLDSSPDIASCLIAENSAGGLGAGISCNGLSSPKITDCTIIHNWSVDAAGGGGGIYCNGCTEEIIISNCVVTDNSAYAWAGGIGCASSHVKIINCRIENNSSYYSGGVFLASSTCEIINCTITGNNAGGNAGAMECYNSNPVITNCTIANNTANDKAGGLLCIESCPTLNNTILWGNSTAGSGNQIFTWDTVSVVTLDYCDYADGPNDIAGLGTVTQLGGCIHLDPLFVGNGDFRLQDTSPCIDAGDNDLVPEGIETDLDGNPRIVNEIVDIGAYEYQVVDDTPPVITILSPQPEETWLYGEERHCKFYAEDDLSGVKSIEAAINEMPVESCQTIVVSDLPLGENTLMVIAEDYAGNVSEETVIFYVDVTFDSVIAAVERFYNEGYITDISIRDGLIDKLTASKNADEREKYDVAIKQLYNFCKLLENHRYRSIDEDAYGYLLQDERELKEGVRREKPATWGPESFPLGAERGHPKLTKTEDNKIKWKYTMGQVILKEIELKPAWAKDNPRGLDLACCGITGNFYHEPDTPQNQTQQPIFIGQKGNVGIYRCAKHVVIEVFPTQCCENIEFVQIAKLREFLWKNNAWDELENDGEWKVDPSVEVNKDAKYDEKRTKTTTTAGSKIMIDAPGYKDLWAPGNLPNEKLKSNWEFETWVVCVDSEGKVTTVCGKFCWGFEMIIDIGVDAQSTTYTLKQKQPEYTPLVELLEGQRETYKKCIKAFYEKVYPEPEGENPQQKRIREGKIQSGIDKYIPTGF